MEAQANNPEKNNSDNERINFLLSLPRLSEETKALKISDETNQTNENEINFEFGEEKIKGCIIQPTEVQMGKETKYVLEFVEAMNENENKAMEHFLKEQSDKVNLVRIRISIPNQNIVSFNGSQGDFLSTLIDDIEIFQKKRNESMERASEIITLEREGRSERTQQIINQYKKTRAEYDSRVKELKEYIILTDEEADRADEEVEKIINAAEVNETEANQRENAIESDDEISSGSNPNKTVRVTRIQRNNNEIRLNEYERIEGYIENERFEDFLVREREFNNDFDSVISEKNKIKSFDILTKNPDKKKPTKRIVIYGENENYAQLSEKIESKIKELQEKYGLDYNLSVSFLAPVNTNWRELARTGTKSVLNKIEGEYTREFRESGFRKLDFEIIGTNAKNFFIDSEKQSRITIGIDGRGETREKRQEERIQATSPRRRFIPADHRKVAPLAKRLQKEWINQKPIGYEEMVTDTDGQVYQARVREHTLQASTGRRGKFYAVEIWKPVEENT